MCATIINYGNHAMKKIIVLAALSVAAVCTLSTGCSGCNKENKNILPLSSNWYSDTSYKHIQPTLSSDKYPSERLVYSVKQSFLDRGANTTYKVEYAEGEYVTEFFATEFDKSLVHASFTDYPDKDFNVYCYKTEFHCPEVKYTFGSETKTFTDDVTTVCYFASVGDNLRPFYSETDVKSPSPAAYGAPSLDKCYVEFDRTYKTYYNFAGTAAISAMTARDGGESFEKPVAIGDTLNSVFDVNSLAVVTRALSASSLPQTMNLVTAANGMQEFRVNAYAGTAYTFSDEERSAAAELLTAKGMYTPKEDSSLATVSMTVTSTLSLSGVEPVYWFAKVENATNNKSRATLLKYVEPLTYGLGYLTYNLKEISSVFWNDVK